MSRSTEVDGTSFYTGMATPNEHFHASPYVVL